MFPFGFLEPKVPCSVCITVYNHKYFNYHCNTCMTFFELRLFYVWYVQNDSTSAIQQFIEFCFVNPSINNLKYIL